MDDVLGYEGKKVVMTGAASGMGAAAAHLLVELGAEVHALDIGDVTAPVTQSIRTDMKSKASIDAAITQLPGDIDILFNCAGVPHPPALALDTVMINFVGLRHLTDSLIPRIQTGGSIASIASTAGMAWKSNLENVRTCLALETFDATAAWLADEPDLAADPYGFSKQCIIVYTQTLAGELASRGIRINCIAPGAIETEGWKVYSAEARALYHRSNPMMRNGSPWEVAEACAYLASPASAYVTGEVMHVAGGGQHWGETWTIGKPDYFKE